MSPILLEPPTNFHAASPPAGVTARMDSSLNSSHTCSALLSSNFSIRAGPPAAHRCCKPGTAAVALAALRGGAPRSEVALLTFFGLESGIDAEPCGVSVDAVEPRSGAVCSLDIGQDRLAPLARAGHSAVHELMKQWLGVHRQHRERLRPCEWVRVIRSLVVPQFVFALASGALRCVLCQATVRTHGASTLSRAPLPCAWRRGKVAAKTPQITLATRLGN